jgi:hypothetical protein
MDPKVAGYLEHVESLARRARNVFFASLLVCSLLALNLTFFRNGSVGQLASIRLSFGPLLLWSLAVAAYAFQSLSRTNSRLTRKVTDILDADQARARRQLQMIRARLRDSSRQEE